MAIPRVPRSLFLLQPFACVVCSSRNPLPECVPQVSVRGPLPPGSLPRVLPWFSSLAAVPFVCSGHGRLQSGGFKQQTLLSRGSGRGSPRPSPADCVSAGSSPPGFLLPLHRARREGESCGSPLTGTGIPSGASPSQPHLTRITPRETDPFSTGSHTGVRASPYGLEGTGGCIPTAGCACCRWRWPTPRPSGLRSLGGRACLKHPGSWPPVLLRRCAGAVFPISRPLCGLVKVGSEALAPTGPYLIHVADRMAPWASDLQRQVYQPGRWAR